MDGVPSSPLNFIKTHIVGFYLKFFSKRISGSFL